MMFEIGRLCVKIAGRDAMQKCVVIDVLDNGFVLIDGQTRRRKCNTLHLEPLDEQLKIKKGESHDVVVAELKKLGIDVKESKPKKSADRPKRMRVKKPVKAKPADKDSEKKVDVQKPADKATDKPAEQKSEQKSSSQESKA